jgi:hypothetical protein
MSDVIEVNRVSKFAGCLIRKLKRFGPKKYGFVTIFLSVGGVVNEVHAVLDPETLDRKEVAKEALKWKEGDLVQLQGEVVKIGKCECCGNPLPVVDAFKCHRIDAHPEIK